MASSNKSKKNRTKPPQGRPASTVAISQPAVEDASHIASLSSFSPAGNYFAFLSLAIDKHRLYIYDSSSGQSVAECIVDSAPVSALTWANFDPLNHPTSNRAEMPPNKKRRKKRDSLAAAEEAQSKVMDVVVLGLSDGTILFFSPTHGRLLRTLSHSTSTAKILSIVVAENGDNPPTIWTSGADGAIRLWDAHKNNVLGSWKTDDRIPYSSMAVWTTNQVDRVDVLVAHHSIRLLSTTKVTEIEAKKPKQLSSFTGHASSVRNLQWDTSQTPPNRFLSMAEADRFLYIWEVPRGSSTEGQQVAAIPLDSEARAFALAIPKNSPNATGKQTLLTVSASGKISVFPIPTELASPASSNRTEYKLPTLLSRSNLIASSKQASSLAPVVDASFVSGKEGSIRVARLVGGIRPVFDVVQYLDNSGEFIQDVVIDDVNTELMNDSQVNAPNKRYAEPSSVAIVSGLELDHDEEMDDLALHNVDGELDVDLAELSLGQRLTALSGVEAMRSSDTDEEITPKEHKAVKKSKSEVSTVPSSSLTRTLIQALHSSDSRLLEMCLAHSDPALVQNSVRRLPSQLAVPLIIACVERLGRGARAGNLKGKGGGASSQRGTGLITWVKTVLAVHSGHLMTIPDLVARLSSLHATLTARLTLQESLLSLSGRLDMVISQIEMRSSEAPAPLTPWKEREATGAQAKQYIEGESEESDDDGKMEVEVESGDDGGSIEDVELGGDSAEDESSEDDYESDDDEDKKDDSESPTMNGFIDDEAEEYSNEDDESE